MQRLNASLISNHALSLFLAAATFAVLPAGSSIHAQPAPGANLPAEAGVWYDDTGKGAVEIAPCGGNLCGHIVWLNQPLNKEGQPLRDIYNPEPSRRGQPICGLQVLGNLSRQPDGSLDGGWVYDPKVGKAYDAELRLNNANHLLVRGYAGLKMLGKTLNWRRADRALPSCAQSAGAGNARR